MANSVARAPCTRSAKLLSDLRIARCRTWLSRPRQNRERTSAAAANTGRQWAASRMGSSRPRGRSVYQTCVEDAKADNGHYG